MPAWVWVVIIIVAVLAIGMVRERWRGSGMDAWAKANGFTVRSPFQPTATPPAVDLSKQFGPKGARIWGAGVEGTVGGRPVVIAEHEVSGSGISHDPDRWFTLLMWPVDPGVAPGPVGSWTGDGKVVVYGGYAGWRIEGLLSPNTLPSLVAQIAAANRAIATGS